MLTGEIEVSHEQTNEETPTFGVINDGRTYPAVVARKRQQNGSPRSTLYTVSKNGAYKDLYDQFEQEVIQPYFERQRQRQNGSQHPDGNTARANRSGDGDKGNTQGDRQHPFGF